MPLAMHALKHGCAAVVTPGMQSLFDCVFANRICSRSQVWSLAARVNGSPLRIAGGDGVKKRAADAAAAAAAVAERAPLAVP